MLDEISISGYKSIKKLENFPLRNINILIGANGAGKSNLISVFRLINHIYNQQLQAYTKIKNIDSLFYFGTKNTDTISFDFKFNNGNNHYMINLKSTDDNKILVDNDYLTFIGASKYYYLTRNEYESNLCYANQIISSPFVAKYCMDSIKSWKLYHFNDTSDNAPMKRQCEKNDNAIYKPNASNIAAYIKMLHDKYKDHYYMIVEAIQNVAPFFGGFVIRDDDVLQLEWFDKADPDTPLRANMLSDGTIRFICLSVLLLQPIKLMPELILIDEPELGLHPHAIEYLANLIKRIDNRQFIISSQSVEFLNHFTVDDIVVIERQNNQSIFKRLQKEDLEVWLEDYSLGTIWNSNIIGGRP